MFEDKLFQFFFFNKRNITDTVKTSTFLLHEHECQLVKCLKKMIIKISIHEPLVENRCKD